jgi:hypothetical protein
MLTISYGELSGDRQSSKADILDLRPEVLAKGLGCGEHAREELVERTLPIT